MKKILLILGILFTQTLYAANIQVGPITYSILSQEELTVKVVGMDKFYNKPTLTIPPKIQYNEQTYTVISIGKFTVWTETLDIPATVTDFSFSYNNFDSRLAYITVDEANPIFASVDGILYTKNLDTLIYCPSKRMGEIKIPESVTTIGNYAFNESQFLESIELPEGVKKIEDSAFNYCEKLENITLPSTLEEIGQFAFNYCKSLETIIIPNSVYKLGDYAFFWCSGLKSIKLSDSLEVLGSCIFSDCWSLESIEIPSSVRELGIGAFLECLNLESIYIPAQLEKLDGAFYYCPKLLNIIIDEENPYFSAENGIIFNKDKTVLVAYPSAGESVEVHEGITEIGGAAFQGSENLTTVTLPATIEKIGAEAFYDCYELQKLIVFATTPPELASSAFTAECDPLPNPDIFVPAESLELYKSAPRWSSRKNKIFSIEGSSGVKEDSVDYDVIFNVFSILGLHILTTTNKDDLQNLPTGLYIINGKKIFWNN